MHYERYLNGYEATLTGASITSVEEPVTCYVPELAAHSFKSVTLRHLLQMTSGLRFDEHPINPLG